MTLRKGIYENIISSQLSDEISEAESRHLVCCKQDIDTAESPRMLAEYLADVVRRKLDDESLSA